MDPITMLAQIPGIGPAIPYIVAAGAICALIATMLPAPSATSSSGYVGLYRAINWMALNIGYARNAKAPGAPEAGPIKSQSGTIGALLAACLILQIGMLAGCGGNSAPIVSTAAVVPAQSTALSISTGATAVAPSALAIVNNISPKIVSDLNAACPLITGSLSAAMSCASGNGAIAQAQNLTAASCTEAGKLQLMVNDATAAAAGPTATNSGNSEAWLKNIATDAIALAPYACPVAKALLASVK